MQGIDAQIIQTVIHKAGTCPGCGEGGCYAGRHCPCGGCACPAAAITVSLADQNAQQHNLARYGQLQQLRKGQANTYEQTRYR